MKQIQFHTDLLLIEYLHFVFTLWVLSIHISIQFYY